MNYSSPQELTINILYCTSYNFIKSNDLLQIEMRLCIRFMCLFLVGEVEYDGLTYKAVSAQTLVTEL